MEQIRRQPYLIFSTETCGIRFNSYSCSRTGLLMGRVLSTNTATTAFCVRNNITSRLPEGRFKNVWPNAVAPSVNVAHEKRKHYHGAKIPIPSYITFQLSEPVSSTGVSKHTREEVLHTFVIVSRLFIMGDIQRRRDVRLCRLHVMYHRCLSDALG